MISEFMNGCEMYYRSGWVWSDTKKLCSWDHSVKSCVLNMSTCILNVSFVFWNNFQNWKTWSLFWIRNWFIYHYLLFDIKIPDFFSSLIFSVIFNTNGFLAVWLCQFIIKNKIGLLTLWLFFSEKIESVKIF